MKFCWCTISVKSMEESLKFYEEVLNLKISSRFQDGQNKEIAFLGNGETQVELVWDKNLKPLGNIEGISLGFEVESVEKMVDFIKEKGLEVESGPFQPSPAVKFFFVKDPNGVSIQFVETL